MALSRLVSRLDIFETQDFGGTCSVTGGSQASIRTHEEVSYCDCVSGACWRPHRLARVFSRVLLKSVRRHATT